MLIGQIYYFLFNFAFIGVLRRINFLLEVYTFLKLQVNFGSKYSICIGFRSFPEAYFFALPATRMDLFKRATFQTTPFNNLKINVI